MFTTTFRLLSENYGDDIFRRYDRAKKRHLGGFLISAFEVFAISLGSRIKSTHAIVDSKRLKKVVQGTWSDPDFINNVGSGISASRRIPVVIPYARRRLATCLSAPNRD